MTEQGFQKTACQIQLAVIKRFESSEGARRILYLHQYDHEMIQWNRYFLELVVSFF